MVHAGFQLYWSSSDELTESLIHRAERAGYEAIVLTLDTTELGWRPRDLHLGYLPFLRGSGLAKYLSDPVFCSLPSDTGGPGERPRPRPRMALCPRAAPPLARGGRERRSPRAMWRTRSAGSSHSTRAPNLSWGHLPFLRERSRLPILLKGILDPDDARWAVRAGVIRGLKTMVAAIVARELPG